MLSNVTLCKNAALNPEVIGHAAAISTWGRFTPDGDGVLIELPTGMRVRVNSDHRVWEYSTRKQTWKPMPSATLYLVALALWAKGRDHKEEWLWTYSRKEVATDDWTTVQQAYAFVSHEKYNQKHIPIPLGIDE